ncbi:MAG TPA: hypothetical protein VLF93_00545 [Candidatus Saccharimonadales bacterium]|nr:hypothetical protein [Candidatus Saccharimonadales bacterium]
MSILEAERGRASMKGTLKQLMPSHPASSRRAPETSLWRAADDLLTAATGQLKHRNRHVPGSSQGISWTRGEISTNNGEGVYTLDTQGRTAVVNGQATTRENGTRVTVDQAEPDGTIWRVRADVPHDPVDAEEATIQAFKLSSNGENTVNFGVNTHLSHSLVQVMTGMLEGLGDQVDGVRNPITGKGQQQVYPKPEGSKPETLKLKDKAENAAAEAAEAARIAAMNQGPEAYSAFMHRRAAEMALGQR